MKRKDSILLLLMLIMGLCSIFSLMLYTIPNETKNFKDMPLSERLNIYYNNFHPKFDYLNGLWLSFAGIFIILGLEFLEMPNPFIFLDKKFSKLLYKYKH